MKEDVRVTKWLSGMGVASRREVERMIDAGDVEVNGERVRDKGRKIVPGTDEVRVRGEVIKSDNELVYVALHKPVDVLSAVKDPQGRKTVVSLFKMARMGGTDSDTAKQIRRMSVWPVGRLDLDSRGLILLTNDGELTHRLTHPKWHVPKHYRVVVWGSLEEWKVRKLRTGVTLPDGVTAPAEVEVEANTKEYVKESEEIENDEEETELLNENGEVSEAVEKKSRDWKGRRQVLRITLYEGKHRQIRRMCAALQLEVTDLQRLKFGDIELGDQPEGETRLLTQEEVMSLMVAVEIPVDE